jgi:guanylate kinase
MSRQHTENDSSPHHSPVRSWFGRAKTYATRVRKKRANSSAPRGRMIVLSGPTAVGKGTVEAALRAKHPNVWVSVSATTRQPRPGEKNGVDYYFVTPEKFRQMRQNNEFLETAVVHNMADYGTPLRPVQEHLKARIPTILEIDLQGARRVREKAAELGIDVLFVFLAPPSFDDLITRLAERGTENEEQRMKRLATARIELGAEREFDRVIVNDRVERAADELWRLVAQEYGLNPDE